MANAVSRYGSGRLPVAAWTRLYEERVRRNLTQKEAAKIIGVAQQTLSYWEQGRCRPITRHRDALATFLRMEMPSLRTEISTVFPYIIE